MSAALAGRRGALRALGAAAAAGACGIARAEQAPALAAVKARGVLRVAVYRDMPPFHEQG